MRNKTPEINSVIQKNVNNSSAKFSVVPVGSAFSDNNLKKNVALIKIMLIT